MGLFNNNKRGFMGITIIIVIVLIIFALINLVVFKAFNEVNDFVQTDDDMTNSSKAVVQDLNDRYTSTFDGAFITVFVLLFIVGMAVSWMSFEHPFFLVGSIVIMIFILLAGGILSNVWGDFTNEDDYSDLAPQFTVTDWILDHYLMVSLGMVLSMITVIFMRNRT